MSFFEGGFGRLFFSALTKDAPAYVQFYVTARCNLACEQCNVIYANADQEECSLDEAKKIAENLAKIGTSVVLLTGGEPFVRKDIVEIAKAMLDNEVHPRIQTNGKADRSQLEQLAKIGVHDVSISLDSLLPEVQDTINGAMKGSWERAIHTMADVNAVFPEEMFSVFGCVLMRRNLRHITSVIKFATAIGWWVSLVPAHQTSVTEPRSFSSFNPALQFKPSEWNEVAEVLEEVKNMRDSGFNVYDSDEYLDDIYRYIKGEPILWRRRNQGICDSPNLYFAIQPNGDMAVCCDYRLPESIPVFADDFPKRYRERQLRSKVTNITSQCSGCMYGSFPEISISARYFQAMRHRAGLFLSGKGVRKRQRYTGDQMVELANDIATTEKLA